MKNLNEAIFSVLKIISKTWIDANTFAHTFQWKQPITVSYTLEAHQYSNYQQAVEFVPFPPFSSSVVRLCSASQSSVFRLGWNEFIMLQTLTAKSLEKQMQLPIILCVHTSTVSYHYCTTYILWPLPMYNYVR